MLRNNSILQHVDLSQVLFYVIIITCKLNKPHTWFGTDMHVAPAVNAQFLNILKNPFHKQERK